MKRQKQQSSLTDNSNNKQQKYQQPYCAHMLQCHVEQSAHMLAASFIQMNPMWIKMGAKYEEVFSVIRGRMIVCCRGQNSFVLIDPNSNRIIGVSYNIDLVDHFAAKTMPNNSQFFKVLGKYAGELENQYFQQLKKTAKKGQYIYTYGGAVDPAAASKGYARKFWSITLVFLREAGYKTYIGRSTNRITTKGFTQFGAQILKVVHITEPGVKDQFLQLIQVDLNKLKFGSLGKYYFDKKYEEDDQDSNE